MKQLILSLVAILAALGIPLHAETVAFVAQGATETEGYIIPNGSIIGKDFTSNGITLNWTKKNNSASNVTSNAVRWYQNDLLTITSSVDVTITKLIFVVADGSKGAFTANMGKVEGSGTAKDSQIIWSGKAATGTSLILTAAKQVRFSSLTIEYEEGMIPDLNTVTPSITFVGGTYSDNKASISCSTEGAKIYYTTDGTEPTNASTEYTEPFTIYNIGTVVKAIAYSEGLDPSSVASATSPIKSAGNPVFSPAGGTYSKAQDVTITSATTQAKIYYTTDGSDPTEQSTLYTAPINVSEATTIKAIAVLDGKTCKVQTAVYQINAALSTTTFDFNNFNQSDLSWAGISEMPNSGNNDSKGYVVSQFEKDGVVVEFDNSAATQESASYRLWWTTGGIQLRLAKSGAALGSTMTFVAPEGRKITSIVFTDNSKYFNYTCDSGDIIKDNKVHTWTGASSTVIFTPEGFDGTMQLTSIMVATVESFAPEFNWGSGKYYDDFSLSLSSTLEGAKIYYTTDGSTPTTSSALYNSPIAISRNMGNVTVKAIAVGVKNGESVTSEVSSATYTWGEVGKTFGNIQDLYDYFTETAIVDGKYVYVHTDEAATLDCPVSVAAVSKNELYIDDTFQLGGVNSIAVTRRNTDWTELYKAGDLLKPGMVVTWEWINDVTPSLVLQNSPVGVDTDFGAYVFEPDEATVAQINASAEWNEEDIMFAEMGGKPAPMIALLNPDLVSQCVLIKNVEFTAKTKANTVNTPKGTFTGKSSDGESIKFITRLPVSAYAKGTYDVTGVVGYTVTITKEKTDEIGDITQKADTTITAVVYPVSMKAVTGGGEIEQPTEGATYVKAESVKAGEYLLAAGEFAFTPLADDKTFGYMPAKEVKLSGDSVNADAGYAITLIASDYVDSNSRAATTYYYMQDALGRYIYQKGTYNTFQLSATLPENIAEASWSVEIEYEGENPVVKITNAATGKYIQYAEQHDTFACDSDAQGVLPSLYEATDSTTGVEGVEIEAVDGPVEVYNLQGIRMGSSLEGLPAGLYIVRQGRVVTKVIVR